MQFTGLVRPVADCNLPPQAVDDHAVTTRGTAIRIAVLSNDTDPDGDALTVSAVAPPQHGSAVANPDGSVTYTPDAGYVGEDSFSYTASDGQAGDTATASLDVRLPASSGRVNGSGWIPLGPDRGRFSFSASREGAVSSGELQYALEQGGLSLQGTVTQASVERFEADAIGTCTLSDGRACEFSLHVQDAGEPGKGADRLRIRVTADGAVIHEADALLGGGNIRVR